MRNSAWMLAGTLVLGAAPALAADGEGAISVAQPLPWARWQGRLSLGTAPAPRSGFDNAAPSLSSASLMGDYYFSRWLAGPQGLGGFRATSGLVFGPRYVLSTGQPGLATGSAFSIGTRSFGRAALPASPYEAANDTTTVPYLGFGYTALSLRNGWSFNADLGLVAQTAGGAARLGRGLYGNQSLDDAVRDLRMTPLLQLGVSYSF